jgi:hypothetical protein
MRHHVLNRLFAALLPLAVLLAAPAAAQDHAPLADTPRVGLGVGLSPGLDSETLDLSLNPVTVFVPIQLGSVRVEPQAGLFYRSGDGEGLASDVTAFEVGLGVFGTSRVGQALIHYGGRLGYQRVDAELNIEGALPDQGPPLPSPGATVEREADNVFVGPAVGGEYVVGDHVSFGAEARLLYVSETLSDGVSTGFEQQTNRDIQRLQTGGVVFVRFYF